MKNIDTTLLLIIKNNKILLAQKKRGFGKGLFNGVGGKRINNESIYETMIRETKEEINVKPINVELVAIIDFSLYINNEETIEKMHVFIANNYEGHLMESDEMKPIWFDIENIPYNNMFEDDIVWLPQILKGNKIKGHFSLNNEMKMISQNCIIVDKLY